MGKVLKFIAGAVLTVVGAVTGNPFLLSMGASMALGVASQLLGPKIPKSQLSRLNVSLEPTTPRKTVLGTTAMNTDLRYHEASGTNQEYIDYIIATSAHKVKSIDELWFDDKLAWSAVSGVSSTYSGYLDVAVRTEGTAANTIAINGGFKWGSTRRLTGCSYIWLRIRRTGVTDKVESPLVSGLPNRVTIIGEGGLLYDPRLDSTVAGGSGSHRANDQSTWGTYTSAEDCDNPALQLLWWLLGWRINGQLSVGCGVPPERIDLESFITAANICDEPVTLAAGGTQRRYSTSGTMTDSDNRIDIINTYLGCMNGTLRDSNGRLTVTVLKNDLADYVLDLTDDDILGEFQWNQTRGLTESYNVVRGRYVDPSNNSLYQMVDYPEVRIDSPDGIDRVLSLDLPFVENGNRAQRIAKQFLQRSQYKGTFSAVFTAKALGCQVGDIVLLSFTPLGWDNKPFRVISQQISSTCQVPLELVEENADIYAWDNDERALVQPTAPTIYDPLNNPFILGIADAQATADGKIDTFYQTTMPVGASIGDLWFDTDDSNKLYRHDGTTFILARDAGIANAITAAAGAQATADGKVTTFYQASAPTAEGIGDLWVETDAQNALWRWSGSAWVLARDGRVTAAIGADGLITSNKVTTGAIQSNSVTVPLNSYTVAATNVGSSSYVTVQSVSITATGSPVVIWASFFAFYYATSGAPSIEYRLVRNGTQIYGPILVNQLQSVFIDGSFMMNLLDTPSAGSTTYQIQVRDVNNSNIGSITNRAITILEAKR